MTASTTFTDYVTPVTAAWLNNVNKNVFAEQVSVTRYGTVDLTGTISAQEIIQDAVTDAYINGYDLYWPAGTYLSTASITNFHSVKHYGPGVILRGSTSFHIAPGDADINFLYVATTGSNSNDGLTSTTPKLTIQGALDVLPAWSHALINGTWKIQLAAGTYTRAEFPNNGETAGLPAKNAIYIQGPDVGGHPNVPTALIKEGATQSGTGLQCSWNYVYVKDIKVEDWNGSVSSSGITGGQDKPLYLENVHAEDCYYGVTAGSRGYLNIKGGIFNDCGLLNSTTLTGSGGAGVRMLFFIQSGIGNQNATDRTEGPYFTNNVNGIIAQEHITGHVDWCLFEDNTSNAIYCLLNSRLNTNSSEFNRNSVVARVDNGSNVDLSDTLNAYGTGANANTRRVHMGAYSLGAHTAILDGTNFGLGGNEIRFAASYSDDVFNHTSSGITLESYTINGGWLTGPAATGRPAPQIRCVISGTFTGTNGTKNVSMRLGSGGPTAVVTFAAAVVGDFRVELSCDFEQTAKQLLRAVGWVHDNTLKVANTQATIDMTTDQPIITHVYVGNTSDSITIRSIEWYITGC